MKRAGRPATSTHTGAGEPVEVYGAGSSGACDCCCEHVDLCPGRGPSGRRLSVSTGGGVPMEMLFERVSGLDVGKGSVTVCVRTPGPVSAETRFAERWQRREARTPARYASTFRADAPHAAHAPPPGPGPGSLQAWLQSWLQFSGFAAVRPCSPSFFSRHGHPSPHPPATCETGP